MNSDLTRLLTRLADAGVEFILVGGLAAVAQGVPISTFDADIVHARNPTNVARIREVLSAVNARVRGRAKGERLVPSDQALLGPGHQLLMTSEGALDILGAIEGGQTYDDLLSAAVPVELRGRRLLVLSLEKLVELKRDSTRDKDRLALQVMETVLAER